MTLMQSFIVLFRRPSSPPSFRMSDSGREGASEEIITWIFFLWNKILISWPSIHRRNNFHCLVEWKKRNASCWVLLDILRLKSTRLVTDYWELSCCNRRTRLQVINYAHLISVEKLLDEDCAEKSEIFKVWVIKGFHMQLQYMLSNIQMHMDRAIFTDFSVQNRVGFGCRSIRKTMR